MWLAHVLTLSRVPLAVLFWLAATRPVWAIAVLGVAAATDLIDGSVARRAHRRGATGPWARAGAWLDPLCDKLFALAVLGALAVRLDVSLPMLALIGARELVLVPVAIVYRLSPLRRRFRYDFHSVPAGKHATIAQFVAVAAIVLALPGAWVLAVIAACSGLYAAARYIERGVRQLAATYREGLAPV